MQDLLTLSRKITDQTHTEIMSPKIGRITLSVEPNHVVEPGQRIGYLRQLGKIYELIFNEPVSSRIITVLERESVAYGDVIMVVVENIVDKAAVSQKTIVDHSASSSIDAPMDGMFYLSPSPKDPPFVKTGDLIQPGQVLGMIEVMKSFYPMKYQGKKPVTIVQITIANATPIVSGATLFLVA